MRLPPQQEAFLFVNDLADRWGLESPVEEYRFHPKRKWLFDIALPAYKIAIEVDGGIWRRKGAHNTPKAMLRDREKDLHAVQLGWTVLRAAPQQIGLLMETVEILLRPHSERGAT